MTDEQEGKKKDEYRGSENTLCARFTIFEAQLILDALEAIDPIDDDARSNKYGLIHGFGAAIYRAREADSTEDIEIC